MSSSMLSYDAIIFDLFGTLVDDLQDEPFTQALEEMADIVGAPHEAFCQMWMHDTWPIRASGQFPDLEPNIIYVCTQLAITLNPDQLLLAAKRRLALTQASLHPRHDALTPLASLRRMGYTLGLISDCSMEVPLLWQTTPFAPLI